MHNDPMLSRPKSKAIEDRLFYFGKHKNKTFREVHKIDPQYFDWCLKNLDDDRMCQLIKRFLNRMQAQPLLEQGMSRMEVIKHRAEEHKKRYPTFDLGRFLDEVEGKPQTWLGRALGQTISEINKGFRNGRALAQMVEDD